MMESQDMDRPQHTPRRPGLEAYGLERQPALPAPGGDATAPDGGAVEHTQKQVTALWASGEPDLTWIGIESAGWRQLSAQTPSGLEAMTSVAAAAMRSNRQVTAVEDGCRITGLYLW